MLTCHTSIACKLPLLHSPRHYPALTSSTTPLRRLVGLPVTHTTFCRAATSPAPSVANPSQTRRRDDTSKRATQLSELLREIASTVVSTGPRGAVRALQATQAVLAVAGEYAQSLQSGTPQPPQTVLRKLFERLGATYIKLGQFIASSPTLFPEEYVLEFQKCLDKTDPLPWSVIKATIQQDLGISLEDAFVSVDTTPLACASVAQVHAAVLRGSNKDVVIKVLKPGVEDMLTTDLNFLLITTKVLEFLNPQLARTSVAGIVTDVRASMLEEVDFVKEAGHIGQFAAYLDRSGMRRVATCPFVYKQLSSRRVLTLERLNGVPLTDLNAIRSITTADPETTLINALNTWFGSVLNCETFHADVHAGNLLVLRDGRIGFIDFGIVGRISPATWQAMQALMLSTATADYNTMARALITMGVTDSDVDVPAFARDLERIFADMQQMDSQLIVTASRDGAAMAANLALDDDKVNRLLLQIVRVGETHGIKFPREFGLLVKQMLYFDRYTRILAPSLSVLTDDRVRMRDQVTPTTTY